MPPKFHRVYFIQYLKFKLSMTYQDQTAKIPRLPSYSFTINRNDRQPRRRGENGGCLLCLTLTNTQACVDRTSVLVFVVWDVMWFQSNRLYKTDYNRSEL
jgi:hypothetical protein